MQFNIIPIIRNEIKGLRTSLKAISSILDPHQKTRELHSSDLARQEKNEGHLRRIHGFMPRLATAGPLATNWRQALEES